MKQFSKTVSIKLNIITFMKESSLQESYIGFSQVSQFSHLCAKHNDDQIKAVNKLKAHRWLIYIKAIGFLVTLCSRCYFGAN